MKTDLEFSLQGDACEASTRHSPDLASLPQERSAMGAPPSPTDDIADRPTASSMTNITASSYGIAFARNLGLLSHTEQQRLRHGRVAIAGMGGVGGYHLMTLARMGVGKFTIADPDRFETANFNRQQGANTSTIGRFKAEVMAEQARAVNPELDIRVLNQAVDSSNVDEFFTEADVYLDGVDFFSMEARRMLFREARRRNLWGVTAGPIGFSTAWLSFDPRGMSFDDYFDLHDSMSAEDKLIAFAVGLAPAGLHLGQMDLSRVDFSARTGPSLALSCMLCAGVAAAEIVKIMAARGQVRPAPCYAQFDALSGRLRRGRIWYGNRNPWQRLKRFALKRLLHKNRRSRNQEGGAP